MIRFTPGGISRAELSRQMGLTRAAIGSIVNDISKEGLVREAESGPANGGRRPILLEINPSRGYVGGIDMGATHASIVLSDFSAQIMAEVEVPLQVEDGPETCLNIIDQNFRHLLKQSKVEPSDLLAVGIGVPGPVLADRGVVNSPPIMPRWDNYPIRDALQGSWDCPVSLNNDAELGALGEWAYGAGRGERNLAYIKVGTGIGAGLLFDGRIYRGGSGCAGEIGHIALIEDGPLCTCGKRGCLEALAGGHAIARKACEAVTAGRRTQLSQIQPLESITARHVASAARFGDLVAQQIMAEAGAYLGTAIASLVTLFNPNVVIIGGGVSLMGDLLLDPIRKVIRDRSIYPASRAVRINAAVLGKRSSSMGAVVQALQLAVQNIIES